MGPTSPGAKHSVAPTQYFAAERPGDLPLKHPANDPARIINVGSIAGITPETLSAYAYMASKAAIQHLTKGLARDLAEYNINVNAIAPGFFPSKMTRHITANEELNAQILAGIPMGRMGRPEEVGALAIYLASPASAFMTGNVIPLDGGHLVGH
ncbi:MAG: SDR family oxidoreductase [Chloroflexota bacterium]